MTPGALEQPLFVLAEGPFSALSLAEAQLPTVAILGSNPQQWLRSCMIGKTLIVATDNDPAGDAAFEQSLTLFKRYALRVLRLRPWGDGADWNDLLLAEGEGFVEHLQKDLTRLMSPYS